MGAVLASFCLIALTALAPPPSPSYAAVLDAYVDEHAQTLRVSQHVIVTPVARDSYSATAGVDSLVAGGTNYD